MKYISFEDYKNMVMTKQKKYTDISNEEIDKEFANIARR